MDIIQDTVINLEKFSFKLSLARNYKKHHK